MASEDEQRGRHAAHVARNSHGKGGGHAAPNMAKIAIRAANTIRGGRQRQRPQAGHPVDSFVVRQASRAGSWEESAAGILIEEDDDDVTHPLYQGMKFPEYEYREYPKFVGDKIANDEEEEKTLRAGMPVVRTEEERVRMIALCEVRGVQHDKRWGHDRLRKALIDAGEDPTLDVSK